MISRIRQLARNLQPATLLGHTSSAPRRHIAKPPPGSTVPAPTPDETRRQAEIEQELSLARDIQQGLLLEAVPRLPGWEISAVSLPARDLGGDLYDFLTLSSVSHGIMIGDVSGKGLPAALRMAVARTVFRHEARRGDHPAPTLAGVNRGILADIPQGMVTMLYTTLDLQNGILRMANAGHNCPILINGKVEEIELTGLPLGVYDESEYVEAATTIQHGNTVFLYTDGVVEATNAAGEMYGEDRLQALLQKLSGSRPRSIVAVLLQELRTWSGAGQADDITLVVLRRRLAQVGAELQLVASDVLGADRAAGLFRELELPEETAPASVWGEVLPMIVQVAQSAYGRGLARELHGQLRLTLEEYR
jgi:sigma-B regulation protein RsbU (phosphoserine phosphatase)